MSSSSFEEEVVSLLLDMRERIVERKVEVKQEIFKREVLYEEIPTLTRKRKASSFDSEDSLDSIDEQKQEADLEDIMAEDDDDWLDSSSGFYSPNSDAKIPRKKAPSGSACEKHKRWKKRCPEDCPMRKQKTKKRMEENMNNSDESLPNSPNPYSWPSPPRSRRIGKKDSFEADIFLSVVAATSETLICEPVMEDNVVIQERNDRAEKRAAIRQAQFSSGDDLSPQEGEEDGFVRDEYLSSSPEMKSARVHSKPKKNKSSKHRSSRKYLPQACDRHKVLHAKCPANCPDRMKRDFEMAKQQKLQRSSSTADIASPPITHLMVQ